MYNPERGRLTIELRYPGYSQRQIDIWIDNQISGQIVRYLDRQLDIWIDSQISGQIVRYLDRFFRDPFLLCNFMRPKLQQKLHWPKRNKRYVLTNENLRQSKVYFRQGIYSFVYLIFYVQGQLDKQMDRVKELQVKLNSECQIITGHELKIATQKSRQNIFETKYHNYNDNELISRIFKVLKENLQTKIIR